MKKLHNRKIFTLLVATVFIASCNQPKYVNRDVLKSVTGKIDKMKISYYCSTDTPRVIVTDKNHLKLICDLIDGKVDDSLKECEPSGQILFYANNEIVLESFFSIRTNCAQLSYALNPQQYNTKLTYKAGMFLSEEAGNAK